MQAKAQAATRGTNLVDVESERVKEVVPKAGSMELLGHEGHPDGAASGALPFLEGGAFRRLAASSRTPIQWLTSRIDLRTAE